MQKPKTAYSAVVLGLFLVYFLSLSTVSVPLTLTRAPQKRHVSHTQPCAHTHVYSVKSCYYSLFSDSNEWITSEFPIHDIIQFSIALIFQMTPQIFLTLFYELKENVFFLFFSHAKSFWMKRRTKRKHTRTSSLALYFPHTDVWRCQWSQVERACVLRPTTCCDRMVDASRTNTMVKRKNEERSPTFFYLFFLRSVWP